MYSKYVKMLGETLFSVNILFILKYDVILCESLHARQRRWIQKQRHALLNLNKMWL